jgi:hypothetical protein
MDVGMGHFKTLHQDSCSQAPGGVIDGFGHALGEAHHVRQQRIVQVKQIIDFQFWDNQAMPLADGSDIQETEEPIVFRDLMTGDLSGNDSAEDGHIVNFVVEYTILSSVYLEPWQEIAG